MPPYEIPSFGAYGPGLAPQPEVERLRTHQLADRRVLRSVAETAAVRALEPGSVDLDLAVTRPYAWSRLPTFGLHEGLADEPVPARIESIGRRVLRVRVGTPALAADDAASPMLVEPLPSPTGAPPEHDGDPASSIVIPLEGYRCVIDLAPFRWRVLDDRGRTIVEAGGPEKNAYAVWDAHRTGVSRTPEGEPIAHECFALRPGEAIWGLGEQFSAFNRAGQTIDLTMTDGLGTDTDRAYKNIPLWLSSSGYGVFVHSSARMTVWIGSRSASDLQLAVEDDHLDLFVFLGTPKEILGAYTAHTGRAPLPPRWSFGFWQSTISYSSSDETLDAVRRVRSAGVPVDVVHVDTHWYREDWRCDLEFDPDRFPDPAGLCDELRRLGVHLSLWQLPYLPEGSALFDALEAVDGFARTADGDLYDVGICLTPGFAGRVGCIDLTNPAALRIWQDALARLFALGASVIKADFGEQAPVDAKWYDGTPSHLMHNRYPLLYNRAVSEVTERCTGSPMIWARSAWAGSQRYPVHWGGDNHASFHSHGPQLSGGLGLAMCGFSYWSSDIGGFTGHTGGTQLVRSLQAGVFLSHARIHGVGHRELDRFEGEVRDIGVAMVQLRQRLLPYLWMGAREASAEGWPMLRPLALEFPDDPTTWSIGDQWLLGAALLVAPVMAEHPWRRVYLPQGRWACWWTGEVTDGPVWIEVEPPLDQIPLWVRAGEPVPLGPGGPYVDASPITHLDVRWHPRPTDPPLPHASSRWVVPISDDRAADVVLETSDDGSLVSRAGHVTVQLHAPATWGTDA